MRKWARTHRRDRIFPAILGSAPSSAPNEVGIEGRPYQRQGKVLGSESVSMVRAESSGKGKYQWYVLGWIRRYSHEEFGTS